jgi:hypothetical protein
MNYIKGQTISLQDLINLSKDTSNISDESLLDFAQSREYTKIKHTVRHQPINSLIVLSSSKIRPYVIKVVEEFPEIDMYLTGSWFLGTYFDETDPEIWLAYRANKLHKKQVWSDLDFWTPQYSLAVKDKLKALSKKLEFKMDLINSWWGEGVCLKTGQIKPCRSIPYKK